MGRNRVGLDEEGLDEGEELDGFEDVGEEVGLGVWYTTAR